MNGVFIKPKNEEELLFVSEFLKRMKITLKTFSSEELEDSGLSRLMKKCRQNKESFPCKSYEKTEWLNEHYL